MGIRGRTDDWLEVEQRLTAVVPNPAALSGLARFVEKLTTQQTTARSLADGRSLTTSEVWF